VQSANLSCECFVWHSTHWTLGIIILYITVSSLYTRYICYHYHHYHRHHPNISSVYCIASWSYFPRRSLTASQENPTFSVAVWRKSRNGGILLSILLFLFHDIPRNISQQLIKTVLTKTKVKILQHNRLDADSFVAVKLWKQTKEFTNFCWYDNFF